MNLKEVKNILEKSKYFSKVEIEDDFEINGITSLWNRNDVEIFIELDDEDDNIDFSEATLKLIEDKLNWIDKNKKLIQNIVKDISVDIIHLFHPLKSHYLHLIQY